MNKIVYAFAIAILWGTPLAQADHGLTPSGFVNDFAAMLSPSVRTGLEQELQDFEKATANEIAVVTVATLDGRPIEEYAVKLFEEWKIGKEDKDNGLLLLIAKDEREVRIEVGYGLEPYVTDGRAGSIIRQVITPAFQEGKYDEGITSALIELRKYIEAGEPAPPQEEVRHTLHEWLPDFLASDFGLFLLFLFAVYLFDFMSRSKSFWLGGVFGGVLGAFLGWLFISLLLGAILVFFLGGLGLAIDYIISRNYQERKKKGLPVDFWSSRGGFWGGGRSSGGGFGGFGGGMSGGGGASGRW